MSNSYAVFCLKKKRSPIQLLGSRSARRSRAQGSQQARAARAFFLCSGSAPRDLHSLPTRRSSDLVGDTFSTEDARDRVGEAEEVMELAGVKPGMSVADVGAGKGYYTVRLAPRVGKKGRVLAEDIVPDVRDKLSDRVQRENLENVAVKLGTPDNTTLPPESFDRVFLV